MLRKHLISGTGRTPLALLVGMGSAYLIWKNWDIMVCSKVNPLDAGQKIAFVVAAFAVTAYNLRVRVVDLVSKSEAKPQHVSEMAGIAERCGRRLTNLVVLFLASASLLGAGGFFPGNTEIGKYYSMFSVFVSSASVVHFLYVLFAFERLECFVLGEASEKARARETKRLFE